MIYDRIEAYCKKNKISLYEFEIQCGIGNGTIGQSRKRGGGLSLKTLKKIEKATKIPIGEWVA